MKKQIINISPFQSAKVMAVFWFVISLPFVAFIAISLMSMPDNTQKAFSGMMLFFPFFYALSGFFFSLMGAWIYNMLAKYFGGIEYESKDTP